MKVVLDAGPLVAIDRKDCTVEATLRVFQMQGTQVTTSAAVVAQVWRDGTRQANLSRHLQGIRQQSLDPSDAKLVGELLQKAASRDVVDAHVVLMTDDGDILMTSDADDITILLEARGVEVRLLNP